MKHSLNIKAVLLATIACILWGSAFSTVKIGYELFGISGNLPMVKILFAGYRFTLAGLLILSIAYFSKLSFKGVKKHIKKIMLIAFTQTFLQYFFFYIGLSHTQAVKSSILTGTGVFFSMLAAHFYFHDDQMSKRKIIGMLIGFSGILIANLSGASLSLSFKLSGEGFILMATVVSAIASVIVKATTKEVHPVAIAGIQMTIGGTLLVLFGLSGASFTDMTYSAQGFGMLGYLAFLSAASFSIWFYLLSHYQVSTISIHKFQVPMWGTLISVLLIPGETIGVSKLVALIFVVTGIIIVNTKNTKKQSA